MSDDEDYAEYRKEEALDEMLHYEREQFKESLAQQALLRTHADVERVRRILDEARTVQPVSPTAAYLFAATVCEITIRKLLFAPVVAGLVHSDYAVNVVLKATERFPRKQMDKGLTELLKFAFLDLDTFSRQAGGPTVLKEAARVAEKRDQIMHHGDQADDEQSRFAMQVAHFLFAEVFPRLLSRYGLLIRDPSQPLPLLHPREGGGVFLYVPTE
jgi:hypothetical protein